MILEVGNLLVKNGGQGFRAQGLVGNDAVDAVDEFGREALAEL